MSDNLTADLKKIELMANAARRLSVIVRECRIMLEAERDVLATQLSRVDEFVIEPKPRPERI